MANSAAQTLWRSLGLVSRAASTQAAVSSGTRAFASAPSKKDILYLLNQRDDPDADSAVKSYLNALFKGAKVEPSSVDDSLELTSRVEKKYMAAQAVEFGIQNISVPLSYDKDGAAAVKRYVAQLLNLGRVAGFEDPMVEVEKQLADNATTCDSVKELLSRSKGVMSADLYASLMEAVQAVEAETNGAVLLDGSSAGYKKFAEKVKAISTANKLPWKLLVDVKKGAADEDTNDKQSKDYAAWLQSARVADATAELEVMKAEAASLLDKSLGKTTEQLRKEQAATLQQAIKKAENAKGAAWAQAFLADVERVKWFDSCVAADPAQGPKVAA